MASEGSARRDDRQSRNGARTASRAVGPRSRATVASSTSRCSAMPLTLAPKLMEARKATLGNDATAATRRKGKQAPTSARIRGDFRRPIAQFAQSMPPGKYLLATAQARAQGTRAALIQRVSTHEG